MTESWHLSVYCLILVCHREYKKQMSIRLKLTHTQSRVNARGTAADAHIRGACADESGSDNFILHARTHRCHSYVNMYG